MKPRQPARFSRRFWSRLKRRIFPRGLSVTREGKVYIGITFGVGFAAINTGNNLLFLVLGLMLGLIIASGILSEITLRRLEVRRRLPKRVEAGVPFSAELFLRNAKRFSASFGVELRDEIDGRPFKRRCFFLRVAPGEERSVSYRCEREMRGISLFTGIIVSTRFPFGLFDKTRFFELEEEILVLPGSAPGSFSLPSAREGEGAESSAQAGLGSEFRELKAMAPGDDPRRIHWRTTARVGTPMIRVTNADAKGFVEIVLDAAPARLDEQELENVEQRIRIAATIIRQMTRAGVTVRLTTEPSHAQEARDPHGAVALLEHLALLDPLGAVDLEPPFGRSRSPVLLGPRARANGKAGSPRTEALAGGRP